MIRDIDESKRLNSGIQGKLKVDRQLNTGESERMLSEAAMAQIILPTDNSTDKNRGGSVVNATVVSEHFWPSLQDNEGVILHPVAAELLAQYNQTYAVMKKPRELKWREQLGLVDLELEFDDNLVLTFQVSPLHASLLLHFDDSGIKTGDEEKNDDDTMNDNDEEVNKLVKLSVSNLVQLTGLERDEVIKKMEFWANEGIVAVSTIKVRACPSFFTSLVSLFVSNCLL